MSLISWDFIKIQKISNECKNLSFRVHPIILVLEFFKNSLAKKVRLFFGYTTNNNANKE